MKLSRIFSGLAAATFLLALQAVPARADCSHDDFDVKLKRVDALIATDKTADPDAAAKLSASRQEALDSSAQGDIVGLGHACGILDDLLLKSGAK